MFGLPVRRHRNFECSELILVGLRCDHSGERPVTITGRGGRVAGGIVDYAHSRHAGSDLWPGLMGMPWASPQETRLAIPPAYTEWIGGQLIARLEVVA
jgi:DNA (cytosine-5)-methyltransferase 1